MWPHTQHSSRELGQDLGPGLVLGCIWKVYGLKRRSHACLCFLFVFAALARPAPYAAVSFVATGLLARSSMCPRRGAQNTTQHNLRPGVCVPPPRPPTVASSGLGGGAGRGGAGLGGGAHAGGDSRGNSRPAHKPHRCSATPRQATSQPHHHTSPHLTSPHLTSGTLPCT